MASEEALDKTLGLRVSATAKSSLAHLSLQLKDRGHNVGQGAILDHLIRNARLTILEKYFSLRKGDENR